MISISSKILISSILSIHLVRHTFTNFWRYAFGASSLSSTVNFFSFLFFFFGGHCCSITFLVRCTLHQAKTEIVSWWLSQYMWRAYGFIIGTYACNPLSFPALTPALSYNCRWKSKISKLTDPQNLLFWDNTKPSSHFFN